MNWLLMWIRAFLEAIQGSEPERLELNPVVNDGPVPGWFAETWSRPEWVRCPGCEQLRPAAVLFEERCPACQEVKR